MRSKPKKPSASTQVIDLRRAPKKSPALKAETPTIRRDIQSVGVGQDRLTFHLKQQLAAKQHAAAERKKKRKRK